MDNSRNPKRLFNKQLFEQIHYHRPSANHLESPEFLATKEGFELYNETGQVIEDLIDERVRMEAAVFGITDPETMDQIYLNAKAVITDRVLDAINLTIEKIFINKNLHNI